MVQAPPLIFAILITCHLVLAGVVNLAQSSKVAHKVCPHHVVLQQLVKGNLTWFMYAHWI